VSTSRATESTPATPPARDIGAPADVILTEERPTLSVTRTLAKAPSPSSSSESGKLMFRNNFQY